jgi:hypothetical protein
MAATRQLNQPSQVRKQTIPVKIEPVFLRKIHRDPQRLIFGEHLGGRSLTRLSIGLGHTIGAAAKYSQFCPFEGGQ